MEGDEKMGTDSGRTENLVIQEVVINLGKSKKIDGKIKHDESDSQDKKRKISRIYYNQGRQHGVNLHQNRNPNNQNEYSNNRNANYRG